MRHLDRSPLRSAILALLIGGGLSTSALPSRAADMNTTPAPQPAAPAADADMAAARRFIADKQWSQAASTLERVVARQPRNADAHNLLGYSYRWQDRMDESIASYKTALEIDPEHRGALQYMGVAYLKLGKPELAEAHLGRLRQLCGADCIESRDLATKLADYQAGKR